jgi:DEAD/DEAH box helicase domain-containing protein
MQPLVRLIERLREQIPHDGVHVTRLPARPPRFGTASAPLHPRLAEGVLAAAQVDHLYTHQAETLNRVRAGQNVVVVSTTASGKTLAFNLPVLDHLLTDPTACALYIYPTKALAQDQYRNLRGALAAAGATIPCAIYDGDTPGNQRGAIRQRARILLSNPDMLHFAILPHHRRWGRFFSRLAFVILDEVHAYRGIFGSHVGLVLRRLQRICRVHGSRPRIIGASATIANACEHVERLTAAPCGLVDDDGAPRGAKTVVIWNPPRIHDGAERQAAAGIGQEILCALLEAGLKTICFARSRNLVEVMRATLKRRVPGRADRIEAYRGGYLPAERRTIEKRLFAGQTDLVISTNALELGVDIGALDACVLLGYPGSIASFWQQVGRAGRACRESLAVFAPTDSPMDQYFVRHPEVLFGATPEHAIVNTGNTLLVTQHLQCALAEAPIDAADKALFGERMEPILQVLDEEGLADAPTGQRIGEAVRQWRAAPGLAYPAGAVNLRTAGETVDIVDRSSGKLVGTIDRGSAPALLHPEAVYLHRSRSFRSVNLDLERNLAQVVPCDAPYYTEAVGTVEIGHLTSVVNARRWHGCRLEFGDVDVSTRYTRFVKRAFQHRRTLGGGEIDLPPLVLTTEALKLHLPTASEALGERYGSDYRHSGLLGTTNLILSLMPLYVMCDPNDVNGLVAPDDHAITLYDQVPSGSGFCEKAFTLLEVIVAASLRHLEACPCRHGCPACVIPPRRRGGGADPCERPKAAARTILHFLLESGYDGPVPQRTPAGTDGAPRRRPADHRSRHDF